MISLFIFRSNARGMQYGIGTYIHELTRALLSYPGISIFVVTYKNTEVKEFSIRKITERSAEISIPVPVFPVTQNNCFEKRYAASVVRLLSDIIPKEGKVIFQFNYIDDLPIIQSLKQYYEFPVISIVHFAHWQQIFEGNRNKIAGLNIDKPTNNIEFTLSREREMYMHSDRVVSVTGYMKEFLVREYAIQPDKITVIHNGLDLNRYEHDSEGERANLKKELGFAEDEIIILFSGRIDPCKGIYYLIEAFEEACKRMPELRLVLLGQGNIQDCQKRIKSLFGKVTFTGFLPKETVSLFYKIADVGIAPSVYDHCPYSVLEMMAGRIPLILSRIQGLDELLSDQESLVVNPVIGPEGEITFNIQELSDAIVTLAGDKALRTKLSANSYRRFISKFSSARMAEEMINLFQTLTGDKIEALEYEKGEGR